jgi:hypothetical protein
VGTEAGFEFQNNARYFRPICNLLEDAEVSLKCRLSARWFFWVNNQLKLIVYGYLVQQRCTTANDQRLSQDFTGYP